MDDSTMLKISLVVCFVGLFLLIIAHGSAFENLVVSERLNGFRDGGMVKLEGVVSGIETNENGKVSTIFIEKYEPIKVVAFDRLNGLKVGDEILVIGKVKEFKGKNELIASKIEKG